KPAGRFIVSVLFFNNNLGATQGFLDVAVSNDATPTNLATDFTKKFQITLTETVGGRTFWADYPKVGWDADTVAFTANMPAPPRHPATGQVNQVFDHSRLITLDSSVLFGPSPQWTGITSDVPGGGDNFTLVPAVMHDTAPGGPGGGRFFFVDRGPTKGPSHRSDHIRLLQLQQPLSTNVQFTFFDVKVPEYRDPIPERQPGGLLNVRTGGDDGDDRILSAAYRGNRLVVAQDVADDVNNPQNTRARWYDFNVFPTVSVRQVGTFNAANGVDTYYPSIEIA